jgi:hypothetical protein
MALSRTAPSVSLEAAHCPWQPRISWDRFPIGRRRDQKEASFALESRKNPSFPAGAPVGRHDRLNPARRLSAIIKLIVVNGG